jgi:ferredoxin
MTKLPPAHASSTEAFLADAQLATAGLRQLATGEAGPSDTVAWVGACAKSGLCVSACPERAAGLNAMLLVRIAKQRALNDTRQLPAKQDPTFFPRIKIFARLQLSDEELAKWL